jgi:DNA invertase Pin-like site-specific DNA recombinase
MRALVYDRVSVSDPASQAEHLRRCRSFCEARGWTVVREEAETVSGFSRSAVRPAWERVEQAVRAREVDAVVVFAISRAGRNAARLMAFVELCRDNGVTFASATEPIDTSGDFGRVFVALLGALAEMESASKRERTLLGRAIAQREGRWTGGRRRFGLDIEEDGKLVAHPVEAPLVRDAATALLNGTSLWDIARAWNAEGVTTTGGKPWHPNHVRDILAAPSNVPLVLAESDWRRVTDLIDSRKTGRAPDRFMLSGLVRCAEHDKPMTGRRGAGRSKGDGREQPDKYVCDHGGKPGERRVHMTVDALALENYVLRAVQQREADTPFRPAEARDPSDDLVRERDDIVRELEALGELRLNEHVLRGRERRLVRELDAIEAKLAEAKPAKGTTFFEAYVDDATLVRRHVRRILVSPAGKGARRFRPERVRLVWTR